MAVKPQAESAHIVEKLIIPLKRAIESMDFPLNYGKEAQSTANATSIENSELKGDAVINEEPRGSFPPMFTQEQYDRIRALIQHTNLTQSYPTSPIHTTNQVSLSTHVGHRPNEYPNSGPEIPEDDWFA